MPATHQKHTKLTKPDYGFFHRNEWAVIGTPCGNIKKLAFALTEKLSEQFKLAYVDADHKSADAEAEQGRDRNTAMAHGAAMEYTDKITFHRFDAEAALDTYHYRQWFNGQDAVIVNGNHFTAKRQIVVIDSKKKDSLQRKLDRLTDVALILFTEEGKEVYPFLKEHLLNWQDIPILPIENVASIAGLLQKELAAARPPLFGLVLAGGKSQRMGRDKGLIDYHGKPQREYAADLLDHFCEQTFISCRPEQVQEIDGRYQSLPDTFTGLGPFGAILSAFRQYPNHAWIVVACDLPLLNTAALTQLAEARNSSKLATAFNSPVNEFPEPLIAIWEPRAYPALFQFLAQGYSCPRKVLINSNVELINAKDPLALKNVNEPEELEEVKGKLDVDG